MSARTALGTAAAVRSGERSARDVVDESLAAIDEANADLNAFLHVTADEARFAADAVDAQVAVGDDPGPWPACPSRFEGQSGHPRRAHQLRQQDPGRLGAAL